MNMYVLIPAMNFDEVVEDIKKLPRQQKKPIP